MQEFTGREYLLIDIANHVGMDRETWNTRINWAQDSNTQLESLDAEAKDPVLYRKAVRALRSCDRGEPIGYPMSLDATASGLQILAILCGCEATASNVNLMPTGNREDIYTKVGDAMGVDRSVVKKPIMTTYYGSKKQPAEIFGEGTTELLLFYALLHTFTPGAMQLMPELQSFWNPDKLEHVWTMPDKHVIRAKVMQHVDKKIEIDEFNHATFTHTTLVNAPQDKGLSLAANITHSIDAYIVRQMLRRAKRDKFELATIHDSFWAHPNNMNKVRENYVQILAEIARSNLLQDILDQLQPGWGKINKLNNSLDTRILQSDYALS